jgi:cysteine-rich repeat protein
MGPLDLLARGLRRAVRATLLPSTIALFSLSISCANGNDGSGTAGSAGEGASSSTGPTGGGGTGGDTAGSGGGGTGGTGGETTSSSTTTSSTTSSTTTTTSSTTTTGPVCPAPLAVNGYTPEQESNDLSATATPLGANALGFSASLCPISDIDVFSVNVSVQGAGLYAGVKSVNGGCPADAQTFLRVFDSNGVALAQDTDSANGPCSIIQPTTDPGVVSLPAGKYYVQVENLLFAQVDSYLLDIKLVPPVCGDGLVQDVAGEQCDDGNVVGGDGCSATCQAEAVCGDGVVTVIAGEQCDDGNVVGGDGCSPTCKLEANLLTEKEPNPKNSPNSIDGYDGAVGSIHPASDTDYFSFTVTVPGSTVTISTGDGLGGCPANADTYLTLFGPGDVKLETDDDSGADACSRISPDNNPGAANLAVGTYKIKVEDFGNDDKIASYVLLVHVAEPGCGDGVIGMGEQCDDGNVKPGDGCSATCQLEGNYTTEMEPNPIATPNPVDGYDGVIASIQPAGDTDAFSFDVVEPGSSVTIEVSDGTGKCPGFDSLITLYDPMGAQIAQDNDGGVTPCSKLSPAVNPEVTNLGAGKYTVVVEDALGASVIPQYVLTVKVKPPSCGDGLVGGNEECDDGNNVSGDGCSATCTSEAPWEIEPNGASATATPPWPGFGQWNASIQSIGDHDWFKFSVQQGQSVTLLVHAIGDAASCPFDSKMHLVNANGMQLVEDDDSGPLNCSRIDPVLYPNQAANLPAGAYYVWVQHFADTVAAGQYQLDLTVQ